MTFAKIVQSDYRVPALQQQLCTDTTDIARRTSDKDIHSPYLAASPLHETKIIAEIAFGAIFTFYPSNLTRRRMTCSIELINPLRRSKPIYLHGTVLGREMHVQFQSQPP
jgi:hypothetical protein